MPGRLAEKTGRLPLTDVRHADTAAVRKPGQSTAVAATYCVVRSQSPSVLVRRKS